MAPRLSTSAVPQTPDLPVYSGDGSVSQSPPLGGIDSVAPTPAAGEGEAGEEDSKEGKDKKEKTKRKKSQRPSWR